MLDKKKKRSASVSRLEWPESEERPSEQQAVAERKTDLEKLYWGAGGDTEQEEEVEQVEKFYWNDKVPGGEEVEGGTTLLPEQSKARKAKLNGLREFQNFNDEEKLYWTEKLDQVAAVKQPTNSSNSDLSRVGGGSVKQLGENLGWSSNVQAQDLYRASRWRPLPHNDKRQLQSRLAQYCSRPASSLGMTSHPLGSPSIRFNRHRRSSMSYYEDNLQPGARAQGRSNSMDVLPLNMMRATQFTDQYIPWPQTFYSQETNIGSPKELGSVTTRQRHQHDPLNTVRTTARAASVPQQATGPGQQMKLGTITREQLGTLTREQMGTMNREQMGTMNREQLGTMNRVGSNEDMKKVLMELDNTGYFAEELKDSSQLHTDQPLPQTLHHHKGHPDYKKLWEESKLHNVQLQKELTEVRSDLESVRSQLETMAIRAVNQKSVSDAEKREKLIVIRKLEGLEKELKLLAYSESLTDQTLDQLRLENNRLREENLALLRVMDKIVKN